jgi:hypothetical protein
MKLPLEVLTLRDQLLTASPLPYSAQPSEAKDESFREWCIDLAEQVTFSYPGHGFGVKRAGEGRPISKDTIAQQVGTVLWAWDLFTGVGTASTGVVPNPDSMDITGQIFVPVEPVDHLGGSTPPEPPDPPAPTCLYQPTDLTPIFERLAQLEQEHFQLLSEIRSGGWPVRVSNGWLTLTGVVGAKVNR